MTREQNAEFEKLTKSLIKFLNENGHPHTKIIITPDSAELLEGIEAFTTTEFVKD